MEPIGENSARTPGRTSSSDLSTAFRAKADSLAASSDAAEQEQAPYCRAIADFLLCVKEKDVPDSSDRSRLFGSIYDAWSEFAEHGGLAREFGPDHARTAKNWSDYVFGLLSQAFAHSKRAEYEGWLASARSGFMPYFVSRYLSDSILEVMANDRPADANPGTGARHIYAGMFLETPFPFFDQDLPNAVNDDRWPNSAKMLQEIARTFLSMRRKTRDSYVTKILLAQEKALADFISLARCRIDGDLPKEGDYRLMWECLERELRTLVNTGEGSWSLNLSTEFVSLAVAMFSKLCEKQEMTRYRLWSRSCLATVVVYLERYRAQTPAGTEYT